MLLVNSYRLHQMLPLLRDVKKSVNSDLSMAWLKPFMIERHGAAGEIRSIRTRRPNTALDRQRPLQAGRARASTLPVGAVVGELGMLSPYNMRTGTLECIEAGLILGVTYSQVGLYVQNPAFGFYFLRLVSARLFENFETAGNRLAALTALRPRAEARLRPEPRRLSDRGFLSSLRHPLAVLGDDDDTSRHSARRDCRNPRLQVLDSRRHPAADRISRHRLCLAVSRPCRPLRRERCRRRSCRARSPACWRHA